MAPLVELSHPFQISDYQYVQNPSAIHAQKEFQKQGITEALNHAETVLPPQSQNGALLLQAHTNAVAQNCYYHELAGKEGAPILFSWMPMPHKWQVGELIERSTRCLPAIRPHKDLVALPQLPEVTNLWTCFALQNGLASWQVIWYNPQLEKKSDDDRTPSHEALEEVIHSLSTLAPDILPVLYPMYLTREVEQVAQCFHIAVIGDPNEHCLGKLSCAKAWLHPHINKKLGGPSLRDLQAQGGHSWGPLGYIASSASELLEALQTLRSEAPAGTKFVLKPSWGSGGDGVMLDVTESDIRDFEFPTNADNTAIIEEFIEPREDLGQSTSPTLYMLGGNPCGKPADQLLVGGAINLGNRWPSCLPEELATACVDVAQGIHQAWGLSSQWGLDFIISKTRGPVVVDLNMGRPNGNFAVRLWASRFNACLFTHTASWCVPTDLTAQMFFKQLEAAGLRWNIQTLSGVMVYQHIPGAESSYVVASSGGWNEVDQLMARLQFIFTCYQ
eukprot:gnl/MRDRNA2_/MRDRNA2_85508_c0_seq1.p1 gnl/MRDRNA2_/MRDRNA2_85508_c0~~gnl/MRDRNA2_/MRDRNA2_85508_c0_seq1.p1  ORF type:complete len:533 (-),score=107.03 gnl/MRDRNA2_/MRDRNA2_85508_c0_seq1:422-1927(-)